MLMQLRRLTKPSSCAWSALLSSARLCLRRRHPR